MKVNLGTVIQFKRKEKQITQQQLAEFVGVSKAAVSKWESGQTYPDITLLPILAAYFHCTIDDLLSYEPELSKQEIKRVCLSLQKSLDTQSSETTWKTIQELIKKYYACDPFLLQIGILILNHHDRFLAVSDDPFYYIRFAKKLFQQVQANTSELNLTMEAKTVEAYCDLALGEYDAVLSLLGEMITPILPVDHLIVSAFKSKQEWDRALETAQCSLYQQLMLCLQSGISLISVSLNDHDLEETVSRMLILIKSFHLEHLNPALVLNTYLAIIFKQVEFQAEEAVKASLIRLNELCSKDQFQLIFSGDAYFDRVEPWLKAQALGNQTLRGEKLAFSDLKQVFDSPLWNDYRQLVEFTQFIQTLKRLIEGGNHHD